MQIPRFWSEASLRGHREGRQITIRRFGWSGNSQDQADNHAQERAAEGLRRAVAGEDVARRERKVAYNGAEGLPIREEVLESHLDGDLVVTRNSYGARCLNVSNVLIADVDFATQYASYDSVRAMTFLFGVIAAGVAAAALQSSTLLALMTGLAVGIASLRLVDAWIRSRRTPQRATTKVESRLESFLSEHPDWRIRLYRTPAGLRLLVMHATFDPVTDEEAIQSFFLATNADPIYARMCQLQKCFRARVSPKPWRVGVEDRLRPRPGTWPIRPEWMRGREAWVRAYESASEAFASCRYIKSMGSETINSRAVEVRDLHDRMARANTDLPIA